MSKIKLSLFAGASLMSLMVFAQSVQDGRKFIYYERFRSAKETLQKVVSANPGNAESQYWLGQALLGLRDVAGAREVYRKALESSGSNPLLLVGSGHIDVLEGKGNVAKQHFETAVSLTKGKDVNVLNAIGRASADKNGEPAYAIEKLKAAAAIKGTKDPDIFINMGDAYRLQMDGGGAVSSYQNALAIDPKYAAAKYKIGKVYLTQGREQVDLFIKYFNEAVADDPAYAPAYYEMYTYFFNRDVNKAVEYFNKYKANTDAGPALDYEEASLLFAKGDFKGAVSKADQLLQSQGANADVRLHRLKGYSYDKAGDSVNALASMEIFFQKAREDQILPDNYVLMANLMSKFPEKSSQAEVYFNKAIEVDTVINNKVEHAKRAAEMYRKGGNQEKAADWTTKILTLRPQPNKVDIYNAGFENFKAGLFSRADSIFQLYIQNYPTETYGHYWCFRSQSAIDSTMEQGLAVPCAEKFIEIAEQDKAKNKSTLIIAYGYMAGYHANIKKDFSKAIVFLDKILEIDPANVDALKNKEILQKASKGTGQTSNKKSAQTVNSNGTRQEP
jgi:tetratricopeptide (TPR) repeat protein